jgi:hypothetical protein
MHIYVYISAVLFFILIPILFALLLRAIYDKKIRHIYIFSALSVLTFVVSFMFLWRDFK